MTQLSPHFSLAELTVSETAVKLGISNMPPTTELARLTATAKAMEDVRTLLGNKSLHVSSGYRGVALNKRVGGSLTSAHCLGYAVDFNCPGMTPYEVCQKVLGSKIVFDQLIHEYGRWTHISFDPKKRRMPLSIFNAKKGYLNGILPMP